MCTAVNLTGNFHFFGRNLDLDCNFGETALTVPENYLLCFRHTGDFKSLYSILGTGISADGFPLYFDAMNSAGLCGAGLNFPGCANYRKELENHLNLCSFEVIPYVLSRCKTLREAIDLLKNANITDDSFSDSYPSTPMHWLFGDKSGSIAVEPLERGLNLTVTVSGVLTNSPEYDFHKNNLARYPHLSPKSCITDGSVLAGGTVSLPGGLTSEDRFVRASFFTSNLHRGTSDEERGDIQSILSSVNVPRGSVLTTDGKLHYTKYSTYYETDSLRYVYTANGASLPFITTLKKSTNTGSDIEVTKFY